MLQPHIALEGETALPRATIFGSAAPVTCAVMDYARRLADAVNARRPGYVNIETIEANRPASFVNALRSALAEDRIVHLQLPIEGWGNSVVPGSALFAARALSPFKGRIVVTLHEWTSLHQLRYLSMIPDLLVTERFIFVSAAQRATFQRTPWVSAKRKSAAPLVPIGPNIMAPEIDMARRDRERTRLLAGEPAADLVIGHFGVLYASKRPDLLLRATKVLHTRGIKARLLICGDFLWDKQHERDAYFALAEELGMTPWLDFRGRIDDEVELMSTLAASDVFLLPFTDGISTRRGSFQALAGLPVPLVSTKPERPEEFDAAPLLKGKIESPATVLVDRDATPETFADALLEAHSQREKALAIDLSSLWTEAATAHLELYDSLARKI